VLSLALECLGLFVSCIRMSRMVSLSYGCVLSILSCVLLGFGFINSAVVADVFCRCNQLY